jgi:nucleotide-binding universal stress UspA family protein
VPSVAIDRAIRPDRSASLLGESASRRSRQGWLGWSGWAIRPTGARIRPNGTSGEAFWYWSERAVGRIVFSAPWAIALSRRGTMRILIGVDGSRAADVACELVASRTWPSGTRVNLLGVTESVGWSESEPGVARPDTTGLQAVLQERAEMLRRCGLSVQHSVDAGRPGELLAERAAEWFADLIVVGSRGQGPLASAIRGSVSAHLVDHAGCPVLVARSAEATRMLLATDGTASSRSTPRVLAAWGNAFRGLPVEVISVAPRDAFVTPWGVGYEDERETTGPDLVLHAGIAEAVADEMIELGWHAAPVARAGDPVREIVSAGAEWGADLIVTGSRGISTLRRLMAGSVAHDVLLHARSSVLVVRGQVPADIREPAPALGALA